MNRCIWRSRRRVGRCEFSARLFKYSALANLKVCERSLQIGRLLGPVFHSHCAFGFRSRHQAKRHALDSGGGLWRIQGDWGNFDVMAGFRYFGVSATTDFSLGLTLSGPAGNGATFGGVGGVSGSGNLWDGIGGIRGRIRLGHPGLFIPYYFDVGGGSSKLTWQIASGLGYQTGWAGVSVTYRYLSVSAEQQRRSAAPDAGWSNDHGEFQLLA